MKKRVLMMTIIGLLLLMIPLFAGAEPAHSGTWGELSWSLDNDGLLTINGTGRMNNLGFNSTDAWLENKSEIKTVIIQDGITSIGYSAFCYCNNLTSVTIPNSVTFIDSNAFKFCSSLSDIVIPDSVTNIGGQVFFECPAKVYAALDSNIAKVLSKADISFRVPDAEYNLKYLYTNNEITGLEILRVDKDITSIIFPDGLTSIGAGAFVYCHNITSISIPNGVTSIGDSAFYDCYSLNHITIPDGVTTIGSRAFYNCTGLTHITLPDSVTCIDGAFNGCSNLASINIPDGVTCIDGAFIGCSNLASINIPDGVTSIDGAFNGCSNLASINIPDGVTSIGTYTFHNCCKLSNIIIPDTVTSIGFDAFYNCGSLTSISIPNSVNYIANCAFRKCSGITSITIPKGINKIDEDTFEGCSLMTNVSLPDGITSIEYGAFKDCISLTSISIPDSVTKIGDKAFYNCRSLTNINIPDGITSMGTQSFANCRNLTGIVIPDSVHTFGSSIFLNTSSVVVYCYEYSDADVWATDAGYSIVYLDNLDLDSIRIVALPNDFRMPVGKTIHIESNVFPLLDNPAFTWSSNNPFIVSVDNGIITAHAPGTATITLTVGNVSDNVSVSVYQTADSYSISPSETWIVAKEAVQLSLTDVNPDGAEVNTTWSSSDSSFATVSTDGLVTTKKPGEAIIYSDSDNGIHRECLLHICYPVTAIDFVQEKATIIPLENYQIIANVTMRTQSCINHLVSFSSSNTEIATINEQGIVHGIQTGTTTITAEAASGVTASIDITVREANILQLPTGLTEIDAEAFAETSCEVVIVPTTCTSIGEHAFYNCKKLILVKIPANTTIAPNAFEECENVVIERVTD